jgi:2-phosphosulfolactate phosphatase
MNYHRVTLDNCSDATGIVVVIDVLRAFTTAAYAFAAGVRDITIVSSIEEAFEWRKKLPGSLLMGESGGLPIEGFDLGNSPNQFNGLDLTGKHLVQRTTSGTQGVIRCDNGDLLIATSFCVASATTSYIKTHSPEEVSFVVTGLRPGGWGDEDMACADYIVQLLDGESPNFELYQSRVRNSMPGRMFADPLRTDYPKQDLEDSLQLDRFNFAMPIIKQGKRYIMYTHKF